MASEADGFETWLGFVPDYTSAAMAINGDDAIELFTDGSVSDVFGEIDVDGTGQAWEYIDGWAYRQSEAACPNGEFVVDNWSFSSPNALDGETSDDTATTPFPTGTVTGCIFVDFAPEVTNTLPANGDSGVALEANISINFSEDVTVSGSWFEINCSVSGEHTTSVSGGPLSYTIDPDTSFTNGEICTVTVFAANVSDQYGLVNNIDADYSFNFTALDDCALAFTPIYDIQGSGSAAAITGPVTTQGMIVGDYKGPSPNLRGFYLQDLVGDGDASTSDGIFAFNSNNENVNLGEVVRVSDSAGEFQDQTQIRSVSSISLCGSDSVAPSDLNSVAFVNGGDSEARNRPALAQAFMANDDGAVFVVSVNHFKSKGSSCDVPDAGDGQGNCNLVRINAANELMSWLASDPTETGDPDILLIGDYNSYAQEDPITAIKNAGFTNLIESKLGLDAYSYVFDGQWGYLDQALGSSSLKVQVTDVADYHINADEPSVLDYNTNFKSAGQIADLYAPDEYRVSDHDPVIVGLDLNGPPVVAASPASQSVQYSDPIVDVTVTASDVDVDYPLSAGTQWKVDSGGFSDGLPDWLALSSDGCSGNACTWTLSGTALTPLGTYVVRVTIADIFGGSSAVDITIVVNQEDARATYTGASFASTSSTESSTAEITLAATIQDISITSDAAGDNYPGDIRNATVTFVNRDNSDAVLCTAPVGLVDPNDLQTGTATCNWTADLGNEDSDSFQIGIVVGGYYIRNSSGDDTLVTVSKPLASEFVTGGGFIVLKDSAGQLAGDDGSKANFGFNVKYNHSGRNLKGKVTVIVRRLESDGIVHVYQIKGNVMSSLAVQIDEGTAVFNGKANIQDITDPLAPVSVDGNASLQIVMDDNGEPGSDDTIAITLWNKRGGLYFASKWDGRTTVEQNLDGGNLIVH